MCKCDDGFIKNHDKCTDINECLDNNPCDENAVCSNTVGAVECNCKDGFLGDGFRNLCKHGL